MSYGLSIMRSHHKSWLLPTMWCITATTIMEGVEDALEATSVGVVTTVTSTMAQAHRVARQRTKCVASMATMCCVATTTLIIGYSHLSIWRSYMFRYYCQHQLLQDWSKLICWYRCNWSLDKRSGLPLGQGTTTVEVTKCKLLMVQVCIILILVIGHSSIVGRSSHLSIRNVLNVT